MIKFKIYPCAILIVMLSCNVYAASQKLLEDFSLEVRDTIPYLEEEIKLHPDDYRLRFVLGALYFELGSIEYDDKTYELKHGDLSMLKKAEEEFKEVLKRKKNDSLAYYYLGHIAFIKDHNIEQGIEYYRKAIESDKHNKRAYIKLHTLYLANKQYKDAIVLLESATNQFANEANIYHRLAFTYLFVQDYDKVIENAKTALSLNKNIETQLILSSAYSVTGNYDNAKKELEDILNIYPKNKTALFGLSAVFSKTGKKEKAIEILKKAQEYYPDDSEIKKQLEEIGK